MSFFYFFALFELIQKAEFCVILLKHCENKIYLCNKGNFKNLNMKFFTLFILLGICTLSYSQESLQIDKRAINYYSEQELADMPLSKILQTNYLFRESYIIPDEFKQTLNSENVDGFKLGAFRKEKERVKINVDMDKEGKSASNKYVILYSYEEVDKALNEIKAKNQ